MTKIEPEYVFNIKLKYKLPHYPFTAISPAGGDLCAIRQMSIDPKTWLYGFEDAQGLWPQASDYNEPLLHIEEYRNLGTGELSHLIFTVQEWSGSFIGSILFGSNEYEVWTKSELEGIPPAMMVGKKRAISLNLIQNPTITGVEPPPPPPEPSLWARVPWWVKGTFLVGLPLVGVWGLTTRKRK